MTMRSPFSSPTPASGSFLPEDYVARRSEQRANILCLSLFAVVLLGVVGAFFVTNRKWSTIRDSQRAISVAYTEQAALIEQLKELERQRAQMMEKAEITTALVERVPRSVLLADLVRRMPAEVTLLELELKGKRIAPPAPAPAPNDPSSKVRTLTPGAGGAAAAPGKGAPGAPGTPGAAPARVRAPRFEFTLMVVGVAKDNTQIADYVTALKESPLLRSVELSYIREAQVDKVDLRRFEITAVLREDADARRVAAAAPEDVGGRQGVIGDAPGSTLSITPAAGGEK
jgi:Tfp pilus assembly protein PilN